MLVGLIYKEETEDGEGSEKGDGGRRGRGGERFFFLNKL